MSDHEDLDYGEDVDADAVKAEDSASNRHARVEFPSDDEEERGRDLEQEQEERGRLRRTEQERGGAGRDRRIVRKKMPWATEREELEDRRREASEVKVTMEMRDDLYRELRVRGGGEDGEGEGARLRLDTVIVKGADGMSGSAVEKIFGDYFPYKAEMADQTTALVYFRSEKDAAKMLIGMTKRLRRVRVKKAPEDGEVRDDSDEEEGEVRQEGGEDVAVEDEEMGSKVIKADSVEINVDEVALPAGRWRVVTKHVPDKKLLLARFAAHEEIMAGRAYRDNHGEPATRKRRSGNETRDGFKYTWMEEKTRAGLNIFDREGNELDWDYEHDTRFFDDVETKEEEAADEQMMAAWPAGKTVRGRGATSARFGLKETSMKADDESGGGKKRRMMEKRGGEEEGKRGAADEIPASRRLAARVTGGVFDGNDDLRRREEEEEDEEADADPTPQRWNSRRSGLEGRVTFDR